MKRMLALTALVVIAGALPAGAQTAERDAGIRDNAYDPSIITVEPGTLVVWVNDGSNEHTVTAADSSFDSFTLATGEEFARLFEEEGTIRFYCRFHGTPEGTGMAGELRVRASSSGDGDDGSEGTESRVRDRRARRGADLASTGTDDLPLGGFVFVALVVVALGGWLRSWERIVMPEAWRARKLR